MKRIIILLFTVVFCSYAFAQSPKYVRKNAFSPEGKKDVAAYAKAMKIMKTLDCTNPVSWYYQGSIHSVPSFKNQTDTLCNYYSNGAKPLDGWNSCPHMKPPNLQLHFLTWHRLYLLHLEKIVRQLSGKKDFALPYWNYNDKRTRTLPVEFRNPANYANPLYEARAGSLTKGLPINPVAIDSGMVINACNNVQNVAFSSMGWTLDTTHLWQSRKINFFSSELEDGVHNIIHDYVGNAVGKDAQTIAYNRIYQQKTASLQAPMSDVPSSAFDPIFFLHHCNIDRLWASWEYSFPNLALTYEEFRKQGWTPYIFYNPDGKQVTYNNTAEVYEAISNVDYTYDFLMKKTPTLKTLANKAKPKKFETEIVVGKVDANYTVDKNGKSFSVPLNKIVDLKASQTALYSLEIELAASKPTKTKLVITLNSCNAGNLQKDANTFVVGVTGFFGLSHDHGDTNHEGHTDGMNMTPTKVQRFDITTEIQQQLRKGFQFNSPIVGITPQNFDPSGDLVVKSITIKETVISQ